MSLLMIQTIAALCMTHIARTDYYPADIESFQVQCQAKYIKCVTKIDSTPEALAACVLKKDSGK